jgi:uncharacterized repeat protein (TIGR01451 family)
LTDVNGTAFFVADDRVHGHVLWKSDGTEAGTVMVKDFIPGPFDDWPSDLTNVNGTLLFVTEASYTAELWKSDGTAAGTVMLKTFDLSEDSVPPNTLTNVNGALLFAAYDGTHGMELWKSDGTTAGTVMVKDINPGSGGAFSYGSRTTVGGTLFFEAADGTHGRELWKSDGTTAGTMIVKDISPGESWSKPEELTNVNGTVFFVAYGKTLWKSDGTAAGTVMLKDFIPPDWHWTFFDLVNVNGTLFFWADGGWDGFELWKSDGTVAGTTMVKHFNRTPFASPPSYFAFPVNVQGTLFFEINDGVHGRELWKSDGTEAGTVLVADLNPGVFDSVPRALTAAGPVLFFVADNGVVGRELWAIAAPTITNDDGVAIASRGQAVTYTIAVTNPGGQLFGGRTMVTDAFPPALEGVTWTCTAAGGAFCTASGAGDISDMVDLPGKSSVTYQATATVSPTAIGSVSNTATFTVLSDSSAFSATDVDVIEGPQGYFTLTPCRLVDTRGAGAPNGGPALAGQATRVFTASGNCGIPPTARAISVNIAAIRPRAAGHVRLFPTSQSLPTVSTANYAAGQTRSGNAVVSLNASGQFSAFVGQPLETTVDLVVDVTGYFE